MQEMHFSLPYSELWANWIFIVSVTKTKHWKWTNKCCTRYKNQTPSHRF